MKRTVGLFLIICMVFLLSACAENMNSQEAETGSSVSQTATETAEAETADSENSEEPDNTTDAVKAKLLYMGQASIRITTIEGKVIYIDPYVGDGYEPAADLILVTHSHYDHNGVDKVANRNPDCRIITWKEALENGEHQTFDVGYATVEAVEAGYNRWHDVRECVGYIVTLSGGVSVYVTGDTSKTEQMPLLAEKNIDYAFYCCDGIFNMDLDEAAECAELVGAKHDVPYHVLAQDGVYFDRNRAEQFKSPNLLFIDEGEEIELVHDLQEVTESVITETYYLGTDDRIIAYLPESAEMKPEGTVPMILNLHWTGGTPEEQVSLNGWLEVAEKEGFIMIAPFYGSYDSVYRHTDYFAEIVEDAYTRYPMIDRSRVYVTGFSNGGAAAVALTDQYPELFAAIAPEGWMVGMRDWKKKGAGYDMPFQIIQGSKEYTYETNTCAMAIMTDEQEALSDLMLFNEMVDSSFVPDYDKTPYWGYPEEASENLRFDEKVWTVSNYFKSGYDIPFGQLILVEDGIHWARPQHAQLAWDFMKHFRRDENGKIEIISE